VVAGFSDHANTRRKTGFLTNGKTLGRQEFGTDDNDEGVTAAPAREILL
jgi:hypothetical protein